MIHILAIITAKPGKRDEVLGHFRANMPAVHAEAGCLEYGPAIDAEGGPGAKYGSDTFVVIEKWESLDHLKAHAASPHMQAYARQDPRASGEPRNSRPVAGGLALRKRWRIGLDAPAGIVIPGRPEGPRPE